MSIIRGPRPESGFYILDKAISEDPRLGWGARGLLIFLLGKPDHWEVSVAHLVKQTSQASRRSGRDQIYGFLQELEAVGYLVKRQRRAKGTFSGVDYVVLDSPSDAEPHPENPPAPENPETVSTPRPDYPETVKPDTDNPTQVSIDGLAKTEAVANKDLSRDDRIERAFELFYSAGLVKRSKQSALKAFRSKVKGKDPEKFAQQLADDIRERIRLHQFGIDKLHPSTYLNGERWNDALVDERDPWAQKSPEEGDPLGLGHHNGKALTPRGNVSHDGLSGKDYATGATTDDDLPAYLRG